jgi:hypothetical protein
MAPRLDETVPSILRPAERLEGARLDAAAHRLAVKEAEERAARLAEAQRPWSAA